MRELSFPGLGLSFELSRVAFTILGRPVYWYGIIIAVGFLLAVWFCSKVSGRFGIKDPNEECQTCKNRKYQDGSDEHNVSFKAAAHIDPNAAASAVRAHENQHVANAYKKAEMKDGKVLRASVTIQTSICPECGRSYVSGGTTNTQIKYYNEENPYQKDLKATDGVKYTGMNVDMIA